MMKAIQRLTFALVLVLLAASSARAQATFDAKANSFCSGVAPCTSDTTLTYALTVGAGSNRALVVFVTAGCNSGGTLPTVSTVTYAGQSLSQTIHRVPTATRYADLWQLPAGTQPTSGTNNVVVTASSSLLVGCATSYTFSSGAISASGVDQTTTFTSTNGNDGTGTAITLTLGASGANDLGVHSACTGDSLSSTTETSQWNHTDTSNSCGSNGGATAAGGDTSFSWTSSASDSWTMVGGAFKASGGGATCTPTLSLLGVGQCGH